MADTKLAKVSFSKTVHTRSGPTPGSRLIVGAGCVITISPGYALRRMSVEWQEYEKRCEVVADLMARFLQSQMVPIEMAAPVESDGD